MENKRTRIETMRSCIRRDLAVRFLAAKNKEKIIVLRLVSYTTSEKAMATHSSTLAWKIPWIEEPRGLPSMGSHRVGYD